MTEFVNANAISHEILSIIAQDEFEAYGVRAMTICNESDALLPAPEVGSILANSRVWDDGRVTDEELDGTCALGISVIYTDDDDVDEIKNIMQVLHSLDTTYTGRYIVLLGAYSSTVGEDAGEEILCNAQVLAVWDRGENTYKTLMA